MSRSRPMVYIPDRITRELVSLHASIGTRQDVIAQIVGIDAKTLRKHYRSELDLSVAKANATIGGALFNKAKSGDTASMIFWLKTRARWSETTQIDHTSSDGSLRPTTIKLIAATEDDNSDD